jgi:hypothetical protein
VAADFAESAEPADSAASARASSPSADLSVSVKWVDGEPVVSLEQLDALIAWHIAAESPRTRLYVTGPGAVRAA